MGKFILTYELNGTNFENIKRIEHEFNEEHIDDVLMSFEHFLRGCGYYFDGHLNLVEEPEMNMINEEEFENRDDWLEEQYRNYEKEEEYRVSDEWKWTVNEIAKHAK